MSISDSTLTLYNAKVLSNTMVQVQYLNVVWFLNYSCDSFEQNQYSGIAGERSPKAPAGEHTYAILITANQ